MTKIKQFLAHDAVFYSLLLVVIAITAFGLGRQSILQGGYAAVSASAPSPDTNVQLLQRTTPPPSDDAANQIPVVASKNGTRYYYEHCGGISRINEENKVYFETVDAAQAAGYTLAAQCTE